MKKIVDLIESYKDFPKKGINFKDVLGIMQEPQIFKELILKMSSSQIIKDAEAIISIGILTILFHLIENQFRSRSEYHHSANPSLDSAPDRTNNSLLVDYREPVFSSPLITTSGSRFGLRELQAPL